MTKRDWIKAILAGRNDVPTAQYWMSFFNANTARKLAPPTCHFDPMGLYETDDTFDRQGMSHDALDGLIRFNDYTDRCFGCLGKGAATMFGHGGPGEFFCKLVETHDDHIIVAYETGVKVKVNFKPHFSHSFDHPVTNHGDLKTLHLPDPYDPVRYEGLTHNARYLRDKGQYVVGSINGFFSGIHYFLMDYQETLMGLITEPELMHAIVEKLGHWNLTVAEHMIKAGVDGLAICDDLGSKLDLIMSPKHYRAFFKPWHKKLCDLAHSMNATVHLHSHGAIHDLLDDLVECGFDFVNPFDPEEGFDIKQILQDYSDKFVVVGGFPASFWYWPPEKQNEYLYDMAALGRQYPRFIFMDASGVPEDLSSEAFSRITTVSKKARGFHESAIEVVGHPSSPRPSPRQAIPPKT
jgi:uroporphyrinogen-III decarboxylase